MTVETRSRQGKGLVVRQRVPEPAYVMYVMYSLLLYVSILLVIQVIQVLFHYFTILMFQPKFHTYIVNNNSGIGLVMMDAEQRKRKPYVKLNEF